MPDPIVDKLALRAATAPVWADIDRLRGDLKTEIEAEREACAAIADTEFEIAAQREPAQSLAMSGWAAAAAHIAATIRARGEVSVPAARSMPFPDEDEIRALLIGDDPMPGPGPYGPAVLDDAG
jgi:hypothetical protein